MSDDNVFRAVLIIGIVVVLPIALYHRLKSQATKEKLDRRAEGWFILLTLRPLGALGMVAMLAYLNNPKWMRWSSVPLPLWLRWTGVGLGVFAAVLFILVFRTLGTNITDTVATRKCHTLVTTGPYRWVRHPFYDAFALAVIANSLVTANWFLAAVGTATVALLVKRTRIEEQKLLDRFGEDYRTYMARTGRFFPRFTMATTSLEARASSSAPEVSRSHSKDAS